MQRFEQKRRPGATLDPPPVRADHCGPDRGRAARRMSHVVQVLSRRRRSFGGWRHHRDPNRNSRRRLWQFTASRKQPQHELQRSACVLSGVARAARGDDVDQGVVSSPAQRHKVVLGQPLTLLLAIGTAMVKCVEQGIPFLQGEVIDCRPTQASTATCLQQPAAVWVPLLPPSVVLIALLAFPLSDLAVSFCLPVLATLCTYGFTVRLIVCAVPIPNLLAISLPVFALLGQALLAMGLVAGATFRLKSLPMLCAVGLVLAAQAVTVFALIVRIGLQHANLALCAVSVLLLVPVELTDRLLDPAPCTCFRSHSDIPDECLGYVGLSESAAKFSSRLLASRTLHAFFTQSASRTVESRLVSICEEALKQDVVLSETKKRVRRAAVRPQIVARFIEGVELLPPLDPAARQRYSHVSGEPHL